MNPSFSTSQEGEGGCDGIDEGGGVEHWAGGVRDVGGPSGFAQGKSSWGLEESVGVGGVIWLRGSVVGLVGPGLGGVGTFTP